MNSIATKTGDGGTTSLLYGYKVYKFDERICLIGTIDELSAHLTVCSAHGSSHSTEILTIQKHLENFMSMISVEYDQWERFNSSKLYKFSDDHVKFLDEMVGKLESNGITFKDWNIEGFSKLGSFFEVARTVCRRAEREIWKLIGKNKDDDEYYYSTDHCKKFEQIAKYLNRLSDVLWLLAREDMF